LKEEQEKLAEEQRKELEGPPSKMNYAWLLKFIYNVKPKNEFSSEILEKFNMRQ